MRNCQVKSELLQFIGDWLIAAFGIDSARCKRIESNIQKWIDTFREYIKDNEALGIDNSVCLKELEKAIIAQSKHHEAFNKGL